MINLRQCLPQKRPVWCYKKHKHRVIFALRHYRSGGRLRRSGETWKGKRIVVHHASVTARQNLSATPHTVPGRCFVNLRQQLIRSLSIFPLSILSYLFPIFFAFRFSYTHLSLSFVKQWTIPGFAKVFYND